MLEPYLSGLVFKREQFLESVMHGNLVRCVDTGGSETQTQQITASRDYHATGNNCRLLIMIYLLGRLLNTGVS